MAFPFPEFSETEIKSTFELFLVKLLAIFRELSVEPSFTTLSDRQIVRYIIKCLFQCFSSLKKGMTIEIVLLIKFIYIYHVSS